MATTAAEILSEIPPDFSADLATEYARSVVGGQIIAGPHVRNACRRHLQDLETGSERGLTWDLDAARDIFEFFYEVLRLNGGQYEGAPFSLLGWQAFILGNLFGWKGPDGYRRFRKAYIETGKGSGKSPLVAGLGLYGLVADGEARAEIYAAATKKDQAMILFRDAVAMVDQSPVLAASVRKSGAVGREWNLAYHSSGSFFRPIASDAAQSGPRVHIAVLDEVHEHKDGNMVAMMEAGSKSRLQALIIMITNSGTDKTSVCWEKHQYSRKVAAGKIKDDAFFGFVCSLDADEDPLKDEVCWLKANPSLYAGIPGYRYLREEVVQARGMPSKQSKVRRLNFCEWVEAENPWISSEVWFASEERIDFAAFREHNRGRRCHAGLDLSSTTDLTSLVLDFEPTPDDPYHRIIPFFWMPGDELTEKENRDSVTYIAWRDEGYLEALPGRAINKAAVAHRAVEILTWFELVKIGFDRWRIEDLIQLLADDGVELPLEPFGQGYKDMSPAVDEFERRLLNDRVRHDGNPVMTWCAANAVIEEDPAGNRKPSKRRSTGRIDGIIAAVMAMGISMGEPPSKKHTSFYDQETD